MESTATIIPIIFSIIFLLYIIGWFIVLIFFIIYKIPDIKCRHVKGCKLDTCVLRKYCRRTAYSDREIAEIRELLDSIK